MISVQGLKVSYGRVIAVNGISFELNRGEVLALLGPNGAGKTSIIKSIVGILDYEGRIEIDGVDARKKEAKNLFGYVPEEVTMIDHLTPEEFFSFLMSVRGVDAEDVVERYVRIFELNDYMKKPIISLSMGNKKKVAVIAAIIHDPPYLILDEPLNGLDAFSAKVLKEIIARKAESGGVLLSTHIMEIAERLADRVVVVNRGLKVAESRIEDLKGSETLEDVFLKITGKYEGLEKIISTL